MGGAELKELIFIASSHRDIQSFPEEVQHVMGFALYEAQSGAKHPSAKPLNGFNGAGVLEVVEDHDGDTFRTVYTVRLGDVVYVLHAFQKKSKRGVKTPQRDIDLVKTRLALAEKHHKERQGQGEGKGR